MGTRGRSLAYVRASYHTSSESINHTLEDYLRLAYNKLQTVDKRTFSLLGKIFSGNQFDDPQSRNSTTKSFSFRIATSVPGRNASLLPHFKNGKQVGTPQAIPPQGNDFMDGDAHAHVQGNHVFYCGYHLRIESIQAFIRTLFKAAQLDNRSQFVNLEYVAATDIVNQVKQEGIKAIGLSASMYKASTFDSRSESKIERVFSGVANNISPFFKTANSITDANKMDGLSTKIEFAMDGRKLRNTTYNPLEIISEDLLHELADDNDLDSFYVKTLKGNTISGSKFMIRKFVYLNEDGQTVDHIQAWNELISFKAELARNGKITI